MIDFEIIQELRLLGIVADPYNWCLELLNPFTPIPVAFPMYFIWNGISFDWWPWIDWKICVTLLCYSGRIDTRRGCVLDMDSNYYDEEAVKKK